MYLAHQAKEMESKLNESYATNRKTKRETQAKYGKCAPPGYLYKLLTNKILPCVCEIVRLCRFLMIFVYLIFHRLGSNIGDLILIKRKQQIIMVLNATFSAQRVKLISTSNSTSKYCEGDSR